MTLADSLSIEARPGDGEGTWRYALIGSVDAHAGPT